MKVTNDLHFQLVICQIQCNIHEVFIVRHCLATESLNGLVGLVAIFTEAYGIKLEILLDILRH